MSDLVPVGVALGSNMGDRLVNLQKALGELVLVIKDIEVSGVYESAPMYKTDQPEFLNAAVVGFTELGPIALLRELKRIEANVGRLKRERNGPREIDLDVIFYGALALRSPTLAVPHPSMAERRFVLLPLAEIRPFLKLPKMVAIADLLDQTECQSEDVLRSSHAVLSIPGDR